MNMEYQQKHRKIMLLGGALILAVCLVGATITLGNPDARSRLETTRNIVSSWKCPRGAYPAGRKANGDCVCTKCPFGYRCVGGSSARQACPRGYYQNRKGQATCVGAPPGTFVPNRGSKNPTNCRKGTYQPASKQASCKSADPGHFVPRVRSTKQYQCGRGHYQNQRGRALCKRAGKGRYVPGRGAKAEYPCDAGTYQDQFGRWNCKSARPGRIAPGTGNVIDRPCPANTYQSCSGQVSCVSCPRGMSSTRGQRKCSSRSRPVQFVESSAHRYGSDKFRFLALAAPSRFRSVTFLWQGSRRMTIQYPGRYTPFGNNVGLNQNLVVKVLSTANVPGFRAGQNVFWCKACGPNSRVKFGDTCWGILPLTDKNRQCGCNSGGWRGTGVYYGGFMPGKCNHCGCWGGGFAGYRRSGQQKGRVNVGVTIKVNV